MKLNKKFILDAVEEHGTPLLIVDHDIIRQNYAAFRKHLPRIQAYYAVKAFTNEEIVKTLFNAGCSFDVASMPEFNMVYECVKYMPPQRRQDWIWDKIIYAHPIKSESTLRELDKYKPLVTYDNREEIRKIRKNAPNAGLALRLKVPNTGAMVELSSKFGASPGEAVDLILAADKAGLTVEGISFHVGSQTTNFQNYVQAINLAANVFQEARSRGYRKMNLLDIGGGFPAPYDKSVRPFRELARTINSELNRLFPKDIQILAEPGRFIVATAATEVSQIIGKAVRDGKLCYYINDGVYHTFSGIIFDHCSYHFESLKGGKKELCTVFGPTCDALDVVSMSEMLPSRLKIGDVLTSRNIGAYSIVSSTSFNGFPSAKILHINN